MPDNSPRRPGTNELNSQELCVDSTLTGRGRVCKMRMWSSCFALAKRLLRPVPAARAEDGDGSE